MMGSRFNIPAPIVLRYELESAKEANRSRDWMCASNPVAVPARVRGGGLGSSTFGKSELDNATLARKAFWVGDTVARTVIGHAWEG